VSGQVGWLMRRGRDRLELWSSGQTMAPVVARKDESRWERIQDTVETEGTDTAAFPGASAIIWALGRSQGLRPLEVSFL
jgi:hypothetical protein